MSTDAEILVMWKITCGMLKEYLLIAGWEWVEGYMWWYPRGIGGPSYWESHIGGVQGLLFENVSIYC
jgi:hypothetical protein